MQNSSTAYLRIFINWCGDVLLSCATMWAHHEMTIYSVVGLVLVFDLSTHIRVQKVVTTAHAVLFLFLC